MVALAGGKDGLLLILFSFLSGKNRNLVTIDKKLIQLRLGQSNGEETQNVYHEVVENTTGCTVFDALVYGEAVYMCVGKTDRITVMKYNPDLKKFCLRKVQIFMSFNSVCYAFSCI